MTRFALAACLATVLAAPASAQSFEAENRYIVNPVPGGFEVVEGLDYGLRGLWCAASDYAQDVLNASGTTRLYVVQPYGDARTVPGRNGVTFTTDPNAVRPASTLSVNSSPRTPGANLSVDHSYQFCYDSRLTNSSR